MMLFRSHMMKQIYVLSKNKIFFFIFIFIYLFFFFCILYGHVFVMLRTHVLLNALLENRVSNMIS